MPAAESKQKNEAVRAARACGAGIAEVHYDGEEMVVRVVDSGRLEGRQPAGVEKPESDDVALILRMLYFPASEGEEITNKPQILLGRPEDQKQFP